MKTRSSFSVFLGAVPLACALLVAGCATSPPAPQAVVKPVFPSPPDEARFYYERSIYTSADVVKEDKNAGLRRMLTGESRLGEGMGKPYGVAVYHGRLFVSDTAEKAVMVFDIPGEKFFKIGEDEPGRLMMPIGLDVDAKGDLYVVDATAKQVMVYDKDGRYLRSLGSGKYFSRPSGIAVDAEGTRVYVVDTGSVTNDEHHVRVFDAKDGKHLLDIGKRGSAKGEFNLPRDVTIGQDGLIYVVDGGNFRVQAFRPDGTFVRSFGEVGRRSGQFSRPKEAAVDPDGNIYVVDAAFGNFQIFNTQGQLLLPVGSRSEKDGPAKYMLPAGIAIDADGRVYVADQFFRKVDVYRPAHLPETAGYAVKPAARAEAKPAAKVAQ